MKLHLITTLILLIFISCSYLPDENLPPGNDYQISETKDYILLEPNGTDSKDGILFLPGGLVDPHAYISTFRAFTTEHKMKVLILKLRSNLAIFNIQQAARVIKQFKEKKWLIGGHSLGGVVAAMAVDRNPVLYEGLFLMGSYSSNDLSQWDQPVFSILAEYDGLTELSSVEANAGNLPESIRITTQELETLGDTHGKTIYYTINGGNHAQFGDYGPQEGDSPATISTTQQKAEFFEVLTTLMRNNDFDL